MLFRIDAHCLQAFQVQFLRISGVRFENHLQLIVLLHPVGVVAKAAVVGPNARFQVDDIPWLGSKNAQYRRRVHGAGADLHVMRMPDQASALLPIIRQMLDDFLKIQSV